MSKDAKYKVLERGSHAEALNDTLAQLAASKAREQWLAEQVAAAYGLNEPHNKPAHWLKQAQEATGG